MSNQSSDVFTRYFSTTTPSPELEQEVVDTLTTWFGREIRITGLADIAITPLGIGNGTFGNEESIQELISVYFSQELVKNSSHYERVRKGSPVDALVRLQVKQFLHRMRRKTEPHSTRVYDFLRRACKLHYDLDDQDTTKGQVVFLTGDHRGAIIATKDQIATALEFLPHWESTFIKIVDRGIDQPLIEELGNFLDELQKLGISSCKLTELHNVIYSRIEVLLPDYDKLAVTTTSDGESQAGFDRTFEDSNTYSNLMEMDERADSICLKIDATSWAASMKERRKSIIRYYQQQTIEENSLEKAVDVAKTLKIATSTFSDDKRAIKELLDRSDNATQEED